MSKITQNTTDLRAILEAVKALPEAGGGGGIQIGEYALLNTDVKQDVAVTEGVIDVGEHISLTTPTVVESMVTSKSRLSPAYTVYQNTGGTELTGTIEAKSGDWILATVTTQSATTFPDGWTVLRESTVLNSEASNQRMAFLCKQATADGTESITITQTSSARIYINLLAFSEIQGFVYHEGAEVYNDTSQSSSITVTKPSCEDVVWGCSANLWSNSSPYGEWTCSGLTAYCLDGDTVQSRQANFVDQTPNVTTRTFIPGSSDTYYIIDCVEILL